MAFADERRTVESGTIAAHDKLRKVMDALTLQGNAGIGRFVVGASGYKVDNTVTTKMNFWMEEDVFDLGVRLAEKCRGFNISEWAAWMHNTNLKENADSVVIYFASAFRMQEAQKRLGMYLREYYDKPIKGGVSQGLNDGMRENVRLLAAPEEG